MFLYWEKEDMSSLIKSTMWVVRISARSLSGWFFKCLIIFLTRLSWYLKSE